MRKLGFLVSLLTLTLGASAADAAGRDARDRAAKRACLNGDPVKGLQILTDLYLATNDANYLFNQGRCYEQNNRYEEAMLKSGSYPEAITAGPDGNLWFTQSGTNKIGRLTP